MKKIKPVQKQTKKIVNSMWFLNRNRKLIERLEKKIFDLEQKLDDRYKEHYDIQDSTEYLCKELKDFLVDQNTTPNDIQQENDFETVRSNREVRTQDR